MGMSLKAHTVGLKSQDSTIPHTFPFSASHPSISIQPDPTRSDPFYKLDNMLDSVLMALFLPCLGMSAVFIVYMCLLWYATTHQPDQPLKPVSDKGLSPSQLDNIPKITGKDLVLATECAVCLDEIGPEQPARLVPGCNHGFHLECADTWLSKHPLCPVCRAKLDPLLFSSSSQNPC